MKTKRFSLKRLIAVAVMVLGTMNACRTDEELLPSTESFDSNVVNRNEGMITLGDKLDNPYTLVNNSPNENQLDILFAAYE